MFRADSKERVPDERFRGMNPAFVKQVWEKRRKTAAALRAQQLEEFERQEKANATYEDIVAKYRVITATGENQVDRNKAKQIISEGARATGFRIEDIKGPRRYRPLVKVRQALIARVYVECPHLSLTQIGREFGGLDHTTCIHAVKKLGVHHSQTGQLRSYDTHPKAA